MATTLTPPRPAPAPPGNPARHGRRRALKLAPLIVLALTALPVVLLAGAGNPPNPCTNSPTGVISTGGPVAGGQFAAPLTMQPGKTYSFGATQYGGPADPTSGTIGSSGTSLTAHPDSFAELSVLDANPANGGTFTFQDANALGSLPYGTNLRVTHDRRSLVLSKEDVGYGQGPSGQGPGSTVYRIDVWYQAAEQLGISKTPVTAELAPASGTGAALGQTPASTQTPAAAAGCAPGTSSDLPLPLVPGDTAKINPSTGIASAPEDAPRAVKLAIAAGNQIIDKPYVWGGGHADLNQLDGGYDCSGSSEYILHHAGLYAPSTGPTSTAMEHVFPPGPGKWITVYADAAHMWLVVAGIVLDTVSLQTPVPPGTGPRWQPGSLASQQLTDDPNFVVTHPQGM